MQTASAFGQVQSAHVGLRDPAYATLAAGNGERRSTERPINGFDRSEADRPGAESR